MVTTPVLCPGNHLTPKQPLDGAILCATCADKLAEALTAAIDARCQLPDLLEPSRNPGQPGGRVRRDPPAPLRVDVLSVLDPRSTQDGNLFPVDAAVGTWMRLIIDERPGTRVPADTVEALVWMSRHLDWIIGQPWADEYAKEMRAANRTLQWLTNPRRGSSIIGRCRAATDTGDDCGGPLRWHDHNQTVRCRRCGDEWGPDDLPHLVRVVDVWLPIADAAHLAGLTVRTVNRYAAAGKVRRRHGTVRYRDLLDLQGHAEGVGA